MNRWTFRLKRMLCFVVSVVLLAVLMAPEPASSLTRKSVESHGHLFSYSIQPSWQSGAIQDDEFRLIVSFFNESRDPFFLRNIEINKPEHLIVQERSWDGAPRMRPRGKNITKSDTRITVPYGETLRGFVEDKPLKGRIIYASMAVADGRAVTEPLTVNVRWSATEDSDTRTINLRKEMEINTSDDR